MSSGKRNDRDDRHECDSERHREWPRLDNRGLVVPYELARAAQMEQEQQTQCSIVGCDERAWHVCEVCGAAVCGDHSSERLYGPLDEPDD